MSNILIDLTHTTSLCHGKLVINETCALCEKIQDHDKSCIRNSKTGKIICKSCIRSLSLINLRDIIKCPDQLHLDVV